MISRALIGLGLTVFLSGCMTTQTMPDGSTKVSLSAPDTGQLNNLFVTKNDAVLDADGNANLVATAYGANNEPLYLGGKFNYQCTKYFVYQAKGQSMPTNSGTIADDVCRMDYFSRQDWLKKMGKIHDVKAAGLALKPVDQKAYWQTVKSSTIAELQKANAFKYQFQGFASVDQKGGITISPAFGTDLNQDDFKMVLPKTVPVILDDKSFEKKLSADLASRRTNVGAALVCTGLAEFIQSVDAGSANKYGRYQTIFKTTNMSCREAK